jgi:dihydrofolate synthase / folylpolyglutamate synthase
VRLTERIRSWLGEFGPENHPTFFEVVTLMALEYFAQQRCELVIWETGLGGRLDATNIVTPLASVITNVQFDHEKWLGSRLEDIAREKAGIIKPRVPVLTSAQARLVLGVLRAQAVACVAPFHEVRPRREHEVVGLEGGHQQLNAALAVKTVEVLGGIFPVSEEAIRLGLKTVRWPGRFQVIRRGSHTIILDGAHNPDGAIALVATLCANSRNPVTLIVGVLEDKDVPRLCEIFGKVASRVITVPVANSRTAGPQMLADIFRANRPEISVTTASSLSEAFAQARSDESVVISGSLYLIGEALELLGEIPARGERALNEWSARPI